MATGIAVSESCKLINDEIKKYSRHRYAILYIRDEKQVEVETVGDRNAGYAQFLADIQKNGAGECRYGIFDYEYSMRCEGTGNNLTRKKTFIMAWCPDTAKIKNRTLYAVTFRALSDILGIHKCIQASELSEASEETVQLKLRGTDHQ